MYFMLEMVTIFGHMDPSLEFYNARHWEGLLLHG